MGLTLRGKNRRKIFKTDVVGKKTVGKFLKPTWLKKKRRKIFETDVVEKKPSENF